MSTTAVQRCNTIRERYYPRAEWPGVQYECAVTRGHNGDGILLELGCGREAKRLKRMSQAFARGVGIDLEVAGKYSTDDHARLIHGDGHCISLRDGTVDVIAMANVAEHLERPSDTFGECLRVLKPGGRLVVMTVNQWFPPIAAARLMPHGLRQIANRIASGTAHEDTFPAYYRANTTKSLEGAARAAGFTVDELRYMPHHPHYLMFSPIVYRAGILLERVIRPFDGLQHMILGVFNKPTCAAEARQ
ncbi:MAG: methyltransferase domain-containing protein [Phycisphaerales bacterium]|nr:methyltransferase domain-containing protein [Phycisphaerales bacterium]MCB9856511.1 methyltransferase domain-containing protein [Phycisphaerales bacterium]MCB9863992.1 methyltransferase domain-containing protein [Phycisphaerales bacterium]